MSANKLENLDVNNHTLQRYRELEAQRSRAWRAGDEFDEALIEAEMNSLSAQLTTAAPRPRSESSDWLPENLRRAIGASR